jgi:hypothetical protein
MNCLASELDLHDLLYFSARFGGSNISDYWCVYK